MNTLGPMLCETLARNFGGRASRSELDKLSEPLRKLVNRYPMSKSWLEAGLNNASFPSSKVTPEQKSIFVKKIIRYATRCSPAVAFAFHSALGLLTVRNTVSGARAQQTRQSGTSGCLPGAPALLMRHESDLDPCSCVHCAIYHSSLRAGLRIPSLAVLLRR